jgi:hypothetical protein
MDGLGNMLISVMPTPAGKIVGTLVKTLATKLN